MMRIIYVIDNFRLEGVQRELLYVTEGLSQRGYEQRLYVLNDAIHIGAVATLRNHGVDVRVIGKWRVATLMGLIRLIWDIRRWKPHIVQTFLHVSEIYGRLAGKLAGAPVIVSSIQNRDADKRRWNLLMDRGTMPWARRVIFNSREIVPFAVAHQGVRDAQVVYIPNGVPAPEPVASAERDALRRELGLQAGECALGMLARFYPQKNHRGLLDAFRLVCAEVPTARLLLAGEGPTRGDMERHARQIGLNGRVTFLGHRADTWKLLASLDVYIHASLWEGMPNAVMEAMAAGKPVVTTNVDGNRELIVHGESGWLVEPGDPRALADAILCVLADPAAATRVGLAAARRMAAEFSVEKMVDGYDRLYREMTVAHE